MNFRLPGSTDRVAILGRTGSGKSTLATWLLSNADFDKRPWIIIDYKGERIFRNIERQNALTDIAPDAKIPKHPGLYATRSVPEIDDEAVEGLLWRIWDKQNTGLYIDEAHLLPASTALKALLVTGRSRRIPMMVISQRPAWIPREVFSEANHHVVFDLNDERDRKVIGGFTMPDGAEVPRVPSYHSLWHDVGQNARYGLLPVPRESILIERIVARHPRRFRWF